MSRQPNNASSNSDNWLIRELATHDDSDYEAEAYRANVISFATLAQLRLYLIDQDPYGKNWCRVDNWWEEIVLAENRFSMLAGCWWGDWEEPKDANQ